MFLRTQTMWRTNSTSLYQNDDDNRADKNSPISNNLSKMETTVATRTTVAATITTTIIMIITKTKMIVMTMTMKMIWWWWTWHGSWWWRQPKHPPKCSKCHWHVISSHRIDNNNPPIDFCRNCLNRDLKYDEIIDHMKNFDNDLINLPVILIIMQTMLQTIPIHVYLM